MKLRKTRNTVLAALLAAGPAAASAQSSVTLYGRLDGGIEYLNHIANGNGGSSSRWSAEGGDWGTSMLGLRGAEDLGGGLSALFNLETALQIMNGTTGGGRLFSRRAYVGLKDETWGQLQAGRNLFIDSDGVWEFDPFVQQAVSSASLVRGRNWQQTSNNVEYHSPVFHGFDVQGQYAFGNQPGNFNAGAPGEFGRSNGIMLSYHSNLFDLRGIYDELRDSSGRLSNIFTASREYFVGANVRVQKFKIQAAYTHYAAPDTPTGLADSADHYWLGATYQATANWAVTAAGFYIRVGDGEGDVAHDPSSHAMLYALGTTYNLSRRTFLYGTVAYVRNSANGTFSVFATPRDADPGTSPMAGQSQTGAYVGMMHLF
ncbi:porin [Paraburkholderia caballeronis]|uniref:Outer membrane protein (Porin) n=1 Tax=Paraburkholderia caballeronis TaxID=416943 RepID=A0A1H7VNV2_9BURK|nr:porin [Paraburkholderia caballeronis]PXW14965.1 putative porin [Paraburkholderia caballeronis]PXW93598.1 putative porin [Paraburkholderia caballeronis]RAJ88929.1 putative porin [Paraburkholderia caballeronis]TDV04005.1 putative porin [Paraburkholderia caballeronis]TDV07098.1 putative porin [Paraburkholderia caballeronis]